jgi:hypothetical protein
MTSLSRPKAIRSFWMGSLFKPRDKQETMRFQLDFKPLRKSLKNT